MISGFSWARRFSSWWKLELSSDIASVLQPPLNGKAWRAKYRMFDRTESKILLFLLFSYVCRSDSKSPISPITVAGAVTYLTTASICESDDSCFWKAFFLFSIVFFQLENPHFVNAGSALDEVSIPLWSAFKQVWQQAASLLSSWYKPLKSFKPCCLKWSFCWILTPESLWNFSAGMEYLICLQRLDLQGWVLSLSFPVCPLLLWMGPNHFRFWVVPWFGLFVRLHQALCH